MALIAAIVLTPWAQVIDGGEEALVPAVVLDYPAAHTGCGHIDITGQEQGIPDPNIHCIKLFRTEEMMAKIRKDQKYFVVPERAAEFGLLRAHLAAQGFLPEWIKATVGDSHDGQTMAQKTARLAKALKLLSNNQTRRTEL